MVCKLLVELSKISDTLPLVGDSLELEGRSEGRMDILNLMIGRLS